MERAPFRLAAAAIVLAVLAAPWPAAAALRLDPKATPEQLGACYVYVGAYLAAAEGAGQPVDPFWPRYQQLIQAAGAGYSQAQQAALKAAADAAMTEAKARHADLDDRDFMAWLTPKAEACSELSIES